MEDEKPKRNKKGQFPPGVSGNPAGRQKGLKTLRTRLAEDADSVLAVVMDRALKGDMYACKMILDRIIGPLRPESLPVELEPLPDDATPAERMHQIIKAMTTGGMSPQQGAELLTAFKVLFEHGEMEALKAEIELLKGSK